MAERGDANAGDQGGARGFGLGDEGGSAGYRHRYVVLDVGAGALLRFGVLLAQFPDCQALGFAFGKRGIEHDFVCERGFDTERNTFTQSYGSRELDASLLLIPQMGFLPPDDKRVIGTIEAIQRELMTPDGFVLRYPTHDDQGNNVDGLSGHEGAFLACSFWLADDLAMIGRVDEARALFEKLLAIRNDVGLLAEEWDPRLQRQVGNFPQAFSHVPLIDTALRLNACDGIPSI